MVTHTKARSFKISKLKTLKNPETLLRSLKFVIHQNLEYNVITVSNLVWIEVSQPRLANSVVTQRTGVLQICSNECWTRARWINDKNMEFIKLKFQIVKAQKRTNHDKYWYQVKQFILASVNSYCNLHILFIYYVLYFTFHVFLSFLLIALESWKQLLFIQAIHPYFVKVRSSVS